MNESCSSSARRTSDAARLCALSVAIALATALAYLPLSSNGFLTHDDQVYITQNQVVQDGLTWAGARWAFATTEAANWHPLTWLSHMLDCELWGLDAAAHHWTSLALHVASAVGWLAFFWRTTGSLWRSAFVAAVFALHPLHVESVAWAAERKDVLSTLFFVLTLNAWVGWTRHPSPTRYALALSAFALGLMAKPMLVTLPFVLLLLDGWPLGRVAGREPGRVRLVLEKLPFFALALGSCAATLFAQSRGGALTSVDAVSLGERSANAAVAYVAYIGQALWPADLAVLYPYPRFGHPVWKVAGAVLALAIASALAWAGRRSRPGVLVGWLWYLGTLVPVIGLVQVGLQARADRYTYIPLVGLSAALAWAVPELNARDRALRAALGTLSALALAACAWASARQTALWRDDLTLFEHTARVTEHNGFAVLKVATVLAEAGRDAEAIERYKEVIAMHPAHAEAHAALAQLERKQGRVDEAMKHYEAALTLQPNLAVALAGKAELVAEQGHLEQAAELYLAAAGSDPTLPDTHNALAIVLMKLGRSEEGIAHFERAIELSRGRRTTRAELANVHLNLAQARLVAQRFPEAAAALEEVLRLDPQRAGVRELLEQVRPLIPPAPEPPP